MKRLQYLLQQMDINTTTYRNMYEGNLMMHFANPEIEPEMQYDPIYWYQDMAVEITSTHKLAQDKPVLTWYIPVSRLGLDKDETIIAEQFKTEQSKTEQSKTEQPKAELPKTVLQDCSQTEKLEIKQVCKEAAADFCLREFRRYIDELNAQLYNRSRPDNENGKYEICQPGGEILIRNASCFALHAQKDYTNASGINAYLLEDDIYRPMQMCLCLKLQVQLPQKKLKKAIKMLCKDLPETVERFTEEFNREGLKRALALAEKQAYIRDWLKHSNYCAFVANGSILPRAKGTDLPMEGAVPFQSVPEDEIEICGIHGMGIKKGVTVITGGGYSGKSTLLDAISAGIYNHVRGDGRELCITDETAVTISAEDGRSVKCANISPFIKWLPGGSTRDFSTEHASGSTSQAANIVEAVDGGAGLLLIDEDRSATNFMIRDNMMKELIHREPITPFTDRVRELSSCLGVSTILVIGGSGEYLSVADKIYEMEDYRIMDVTEKAKQIYRRRALVGNVYERQDVRKHIGENENQKITQNTEQSVCPDSYQSACQNASLIPEKIVIPDRNQYTDGTNNTNNTNGIDGTACWKQQKVLSADGFTSYPQGSGSEKLQVSEMGFIFIGDEKIDVRGLWNIVSPRQLDALGFMLRYLEISNKDMEIDLRNKVDELYEKINREGLDFLYSAYFTTCHRFLDLPRKQELFALINRMRKLHYTVEGEQ